MGYLMKGSPHKIGTIRGTSGHASALKKKEESDADRLKRLIEGKKTKEGLENIEGTPEYLKKLKQTNIRKGEEEWDVEFEAKKKKKAKEDAKAKVDATRGTHSDQIKKQEKLDRIQKRQDKRFENKKLKAINRKEKTADEISAYEKELDSQSRMKGDPAGVERLKAKIERLKKKHIKQTTKSDDLEQQETSSKETKREMRLKKEVDMTPEEYTAYKAEKKEAGWEKARRALAGLREYGPGGTGSQTEGKMKYDAAKLAQENTKKAQVSQDIRDARTKQLIESYDAEQSGETELYATNPTATTNKTVELDEQEIIAQGEQYSSARKAQKNTLS